MASYPIRFTDQLRQHLRGLRKKQGLTQTQAGDLIGVSQARIAEIEANPGLISVEQLLKLCSTLGATIMLTEDNDVPVVAAAPTQKRRVTHNRNVQLFNGPQYTTTYYMPVLNSRGAKPGSIAAPGKSSWRTHHQPGSADSATVKSKPSPTENNQQSIQVHFKMSEPAPPQSVKPSRLTTDKDLQEKLPQNLVVKAKKGSW